MTARKSAGLKAVHGTARADRELRVAGGVRLMVAPKPPAGLSVQAAAEWRRLARIFTSAGTLTPVDLPALRLLAEALADEQAARATLDREGLTILSGEVRKQHPALRQGREARALAVRLLAEFGASPASRQRVEQAPAALNDDPAERFLTWGRVKALQAGRA